MTEEQNAFTKFLDDGDKACEDAIKALKEVKLTQNWRLARDIFYLTVGFIMGVLL